VDVPRGYHGCMVVISGSRGQTACGGGERNSVSASSNENLPVIQHRRGGAYAQQSCCSQCKRDARHRTRSSY